MKKNHTLPPVPEAFHQRVQHTLEGLPEQTRSQRRFPLRGVAVVALAAALCLGGTAVAAGVSGGFPLFFPQGEDAALSDYIAVPAGVVTDENDHYRMTVDAFLFDEATGTGLVRLHIENKAGDGVRPFEVLAYYPQYQNQPGLAWSGLEQVWGNGDGKLAFQVMYGENHTGSRFYLDTTRSTENDYYLEGAFIAGPASGIDTAQAPLRLVARDYALDRTGLGGEVLSADLPQAQAMPSCQGGTDGVGVTLSAVGLQITNQNQTYGYVVDDLHTIALRLADGTEQVIVDDANAIDQTLYALGTEDGKTVTYALAQTFALDQVTAVVLNGTAYPLH